MSVRGTALAMAAVAALGASAHTASGASSARPAIHPVPGDWEGTGPHGLGLSFEFVRRGRQVAVRDLALGLPSGCRSAGNPGWVASETPDVDYIAPGTLLPGPFRPIGRKQFEIIIPSHGGAPSAVIMMGLFSSPRRGTLSVLSPRLRCARGGWPRTLRFTIAAAHRVPVNDGLWTGTVAGAPGGAPGRVQIRVIDGGRIETDFRALFTCQDGHTAGFEIGPLPTIGNLISPDGAIGGIISGQMVWSGQFSSGGQLAGTFTALGCAASTTYTFSAARTGS